MGLYKFVSKRGKINGVLFKVCIRYIMTGLELKASAPELNAFLRMLSEFIYI